MTNIGFQPSGAADRRGSPRSGGSVASIGEERALAPPRSGGSSRTAPLEARLSSYAPLRPQDVEVVRACHDDARSVAPGGELLRADSAHGHPRLIVSGWAAVVRTLADGRRQILQILLPGDLPGLSTQIDTPVALTQVVTTDAAPLAVALANDAPEHAALRLAWDRARAARRKQVSDQIVRLGRLSAFERVASVFVELMDRHRRAGLSDGRRIPWPLTQETLADVVGLSVVHVNRVLQQLRREGLIALRAGQLVVADPDKLTAVATCER